ncbi:MAG TPA: signal peptidase I [Frankiaceae bacterium]|nr:signal peptidase I [Frankiaceae bacterium]
MTASPERPGPGSEASERNEPTSGASGSAGAEAPSHAQTSEAQTSEAQTSKVQTPEADGPEADAPEADAPQAAASGTKKKQRPLSHELPVLLVVAIALALLLKAFVVQAFYIPSGSMERTLLIQDRVLVNKVVYRFRDVHRGEIVVFNGSGTGFTQSESVIPPATNPVQRFGRTVQRVIGVGAPGERDFVKRVIAVGGDTVACCDAQGRVTVNGVPLDEPYIFENSPLVDGGRIFPARKVPPGDLWVMGDHRGDSMDSRYSGFVPQNRVIGRAFVRVWPVKRFAVLRVPATFSNTHAAGPLALGFVGVPTLILLRNRRLARKPPHRR